MQEDVPNQIRGSLWSPPLCASLSFQEVTFSVSCTDVLEAVLRDFTVVECVDFAHQFSRDSSCFLVFFDSPAAGSLFCLL